MKLKKTNNYQQLIKLRESIQRMYFKCHPDCAVQLPLALNTPSIMTLQDFASDTFYAAQNYVLNDMIANNYITCQSFFDEKVSNLLQDKSQAITTKMGGFHFFSRSSYAPAEFSGVLLNEYLFLKTVFPDQEIRFVVPKVSNNLISENGYCALVSYGCKIAFENNQANKSYRNYDTSELYGHGIRWEVKDDLGNYIKCGEDIIVYHNFIPTGINFEIDLEKIISIINEDSNLFHQSVFWTDEINEFCNGDVSKEMLVQALGVLVASSQFTENNSKELYIVHQKLVANLMIIYDISEVDLRALLNRLFGIYKINDEDIIEKIVLAILECQNQLIDFTFSEEGQKLLKSFAYLSNYFDNVAVPSTEFKAMKKINTQKQTLKRLKTNE